MIGGFGVEQERLERVQRIMVSRKLFDESRCRMRMEVSDKRGGYRSFDLKFPHTHAMYSESRDLSHGSITNLAFYVQNPARVMVKHDHLPYESDVQRDVRVFLDKFASGYADDVPLEDRVYARSVIPSSRLPEVGETTNVVYEAELATPVPLPPDAVFTFSVEGKGNAEGTHFSTPGVTGREIGAVVSVNFKKRKEMLKTIEGMLAKQEAGVELHGRAPLPAPLWMANAFSPDFSLSDGVVDGKLVPIGAAGAEIVSFKLVWTGSPKTKQPRTLAICAVSLVVRYRREASCRDDRSNGDDADKECPLCFDVLVEGVQSTRCATWTCGVCQKALHLTCMSQWRSACRHDGVPATCPCCRAVV
tara:strand:+ start:1800 stop:2882 length:1083 start_codon:yes stop_codon:yes gene_type:complete